MAPLDNDHPRHESSWWQETEAALRADGSDRTSIRDGATSLPSTPMEVAEHAGRGIGVDQDGLGRVVVPSGTRTRTATRALVAALGLTSVVPLLAWVFELGSFRSWFLAVTVPGVVLLAWLVLSPRRPAGAHRIVTVGVLAGVVGTLGYDLFRIPFVFGAGYRLLSPIESYGVLLTGASVSSGWTDLAGWAWHLSNGIGFAITYVAVAEGRRWPYGVAWAMVLESATVLTPFAGYYHLTGKVDAILIAYAAHVPFGVAVGWMGQHSTEVQDGLRSMTRAPTAALLGATALVLVGWLQPLRSHRLATTPPEAAAVIQDGRLHPEFLRVAPGGCVTIANLDPEHYEIEHADEPAQIRRNATGRFCFAEADAGVHRLRIDGQPFHGGFLIVDPASRAGEEARS